MKLLNSLKCEREAAVLFHRLPRLINPCWTDKRGFIAPVSQESWICGGSYPCIIGTELTDL